MDRSAKDQQRHTDTYLIVTPKLLEVTSGRAQVALALRELIVCHGEALLQRSQLPLQPQLVASRQYASNMPVQTITQARLQPVSQPVPPAQPRLKLDASVFQ